MNFLDRDIEILINSPKTRFYDGPDMPFPRKVTIDNNKYQVGEFHKFMKKLDVVVCPHRRLYEYGCTGMTNISYLAKKPVIVPDFYFFNEIALKTGTGILYESEDPASMAFAILKAKGSYDKIMASADWDLALKDYIGIKTYARESIGE